MIPPSGAMVTFASWAEAFQFSGCRRCTAVPLNSMVREDGSAGGRLLVLLGAAFGSRFTGSGGTALLFLLPGNQVSPAGVMV
jgi:hypothetical protein